MYLRSALCTKAHSYSWTSPDLQECSKYRCDTGSPRSVIQQEYPDLDFSLLDDECVSFSVCVRALIQFMTDLTSHRWNSKTGRYAPDEKSLDARARDVRRMLRSRPESVVLVVSHGAFLRHLTQTEWSDRWANAEGRAFEIDDSDEARLILLPSERPQELSGFGKQDNDE